MGVASSAFVPGVFPLNCTRYQDQLDVIRREIEVLVEKMPYVARKCALRDVADLLQQIGDEPWIDVSVQTTLDGVL